VRETISILHLEDNPADAELVGRALKRDGLSISVQVASDRDDFIRRLADLEPELVIADYSLPSMTGMDAIEIVQERSPGTPVIVCTGSIDEETAVLCLKAGADDYILKENMTRLGSAVRGALARKRSREEKEVAEKALSEEHTYVRNLIDSSLDMIIAVDERRRITEFNPAAETAFGYTRAEVLGKHVNLLYAKPKEELAIHKMTVVNGQYVREIMNRRKNGELFPTLLSASVLRDSGGELVGVMGVSRDITERKQAEEELRRSEHKRDLHMRHSPVGFIEWDTDFKVRDWNPAAEQIFGYSKAEALGHHSAELMLPESTRVAVDQVWRALIRGKGGTHSLNENLTKDGKAIMCEWNNTSLTGEDGKVMGVMSLVQDVTERERDEETLRFQADILSSVQDSVIVTDRERLIIYWNAGAKELYGYSAQEMIGQTTAKLYPEQDYGQAGKDLDRLKIGADLTGAWQGLHKDGSKLWVAMKTTIVPDSTGKPMGHISVSRDITLRKLAEEKLQLSDQIISAIENLVLVLDEQARVIFSGPSIMSMLGYSVEEVLGEGWHDLTWQDDKGREHEKAFIGAAIRGETQIRTKPYERQVYSKGGEHHWILWQDALGPGNTLIGIGHDITEYKRLETQLIHGEKMRAIGELAAGIAHEINSPIQYIGDNLRFMADSHNKLGLVLEKKILPLMASKEFKLLLGDGATNDAFIDEEEIKYLIEENPSAIEQSLEGVGRISEIVKAMRIFSHPGGGEKSLANINEAIQSTVTVARNEWKYVAEMELDLDPDLPPIPCLIGELNQVFLNVIVNAAQAIREVEESSSGEKRGTISISTDQEGEDAVIRIGDTGPGIPEEIRNRIFEPFFTTKDVGRGTGQGLSIAHGVITERHGGSIRLESEMGKGSTFIIRLPLKVSQSVLMDQSRK